MVNRRATRPLYCAESATSTESIMKRSAIWLCLGLGLMSGQTWADDAVVAGDRLDRRGDRLVGVAEQDPGPAFAILADLEVHGGLARVVRERPCAAEEPAGLRTGPALSKCRRRHGFCTL